MKIETFLNHIGADFFTGVPDSQLRPLCDWLEKTYGTDAKHHIIAANEGNAAALAAGYYLATGRTPAVYLQNSGIGNVINPLASLLNGEVYGIPCLFIVGWRGEPGIHDEPQHIYQGKVTVKLLEDMQVSTYVVGKETTEEEFEAQMGSFRQIFAEGGQAAFIIRKDALQFDGGIEYKNNHTMLREEIIRHITAVTGEDCIVSTTGKASRELFEIREQNGQTHGHDFLTVGSMGHSSSIAFGLALQKPKEKIWIIDGDGAALMHMGAMAVIGANAPQNVVHIIINNGAHETVGGMPTAADKVDLVKIAEGCGYPNVVCVADPDSLDQALHEAKEKAELSFIEVKCAIGARGDLGRPTMSARENGTLFTRTLRQKG